VTGAGSRSAATDADLPVWKTKNGARPKCDARVRKAAPEGGADIQSADDGDHLARVRIHENDAIIRQEEPIAFDHGDFGDAQRD
jgi:hypothetical protein